MERVSGRRRPCVSRRQSHASVCGEKTAVHALIPHLQRVSPLRCQDRAESRWRHGPAMDGTHLYRGGKATLCDGTVTLWLPEVLVLSRMAVGLLSSNLTPI